MDRHRENLLKVLRKTPFRTFLLYPLLTIGWELWLHGGRLRLEPLFLPLILWGYLQYRLCGYYRTKLGGGGPGLDSPPERLVTSGPYAYTRNPMYLGHIIFLAGLALSLKSLFAALIGLPTSIWFHRRVLADEKSLAERLGAPYLEYTASVKRWLPGLF
jgi:hypothetical protein